MPMLGVDEYPRTALPVGAVPDTARVVGVVLEPRAHAALDQHVAARGHAFAVERLAAEPRAQAAVVDQRDERRGDGVAEPSGEPRRLLDHRLAR